MLTWTDFVDLIKGHGYEGEGDDFDEVQGWLQENGHNREKIAVGEQEFELRKLFDTRPGRMLDASSAAEVAKRRDEVDRLVQDRIDALERKGLLQGNGKSSDNGDDRSHTTKAHDITKVRDRLEDDPNLGYGSYDDIGWGEFLLDVKKAAYAIAEGTISQVPERLTKSQHIQKQSSSGGGLSGMNEAIDSEGGFLAPPEHRRELIRRVYDTGVVFPRARSVPMMSRQTTLPFIVESSRADGSRHGGVQGFWDAEAATLTSSRPSTGQLTLTAHKVHALGYVTEELEDDAQAISALQLMAELFAEELAFKMDDAFIRGDGVGKPLGILNAPALISVARNTTARIFGVDVITMYSRIWGRSRANMVWFYNQDIETDLLRLSVETQTPGTDQGFLVFMPAGGLSGQPFNTLFGRPAIPVEHASTLGSAGDIIAADMSQYLHGMRRGIRTQQSIHVQFVTDEVAFKATMRADGQPWWQTALTPFQGTTTQSPFVTVAA